MSLQPDLPLESLYGNLILEHSRNPRYIEPLDHPDIEIEEFNPFCGDRVKLQIQFDKSGILEQISIHVEGCSILQATTSLMAETLLGKERNCILFIDRQFRFMLQGSGDHESLGDLIALKVVRAYPVRLKCALLPWVALEEGLVGYEKEHP